MTEFERKAIEHLQSLVEAARAYWKGWTDGDGGEQGNEDHFEAELVRAEDFLEDNELTGLQDISWRRNQEVKKMPIYEFECRSCGHHKEILMIKESDWKGSHKLGCDKCKGMYKKIISAPAEPIIHGFNYKNGYSNEKPKKKKDKK